MLLSLHSCIALLTFLISSQTDGVNRYLFQFDIETLPPSTNGTTPYYTPGSVCSALSVGINAPEPFSTLLGGEDPEIEREQPFLLENTTGLFEYVFMHSTPLQGIYTCSRYYFAKFSPPVKDGEHNALEGDEGEEELSSAISTEFVVATLWPSAVY